MKLIDIKNEIRALVVNMTNEELINKANELGQNQNTYVNLTRLMAANEVIAEELAKRNINV